MKSLFKIVLLVSVMLTLVGCPSDDSTTYEVRDRQEVYDENITAIEDYLKSNYIEFDANNNATVTVIPDGGTQTSIWDQYSTDGGLTFPSFTVKNDSRSTLLTDGRIDDDVDYKLYYIMLNEGGGVTPTSVDSTLVGYKGWNLENEVFDQNDNGVWFSFPESSLSAISGFRQILSKVKTEVSHTEGTDGSITRTNFGNVIVFIPSGLAYFNTSALNIDQYAPIVFQVKLYDRKERDHDYDEVSSKHEDLNNDNDYFNDDTDGDKIPDFVDVDDDGDAFLTKFEVKKPTPFLGTSLYYPFNPDAVEPKGIPSKDIINTATNEPDGTTPTRLRRHLDKTAKPPYTVY